MIQPVSNFSPRPVTRGSNVACGKSSNYKKDFQIEFLNACGAGLAIGGLTAAVARSHTSSWANAIVLGMFGTFMSLFFMTPQLVKSKNSIADASISSENASVFLKEDAAKTSQLKKCLKPAKKIVKFGQN